MIVNKCADSEVAVVTQLCFAEVGDKWRRNNVIVEKVINIYQNSRIVKPLCSVFKLSTKSVGSRRELVASCVHTADADATKQFRRVGGVYWA